MADACVFGMNLSDDQYAQLLWPGGTPAESCALGLAPVINIGVGQDVTIREVAEMVKQVVGYSGEIVFDKSKPDGTPRKLMDVGRLHALGWRAATALTTGLEQAYADYLKETEIP